MAGMEVAVKTIVTGISLHLFALFPDLTSRQRAAGHAFSRSLP